MEWRDPAIVLAARPHGERAAVVGVLSLNHGRWLGRVAGAQSGDKKSWLAAGTLVDAEWHARLDEQLGTFKLELAQHTAAHVFDNRAALLALDYMAALTETATPERLPLPLLYQNLSAAIAKITNGAAAAVVVADYERQLLDVMGYGLDLSGCALTGQVDDLTAISPNSGRAVSRDAAQPYGDKLLTLPQHWMTGQVPTPGQLAESFRVTGHFLKQHFYTPPRDFPPQRAQLLSLLGQAANVTAA